MSKSYLDITTVLKDVLTPEVKPFVRNVLVVGLLYSVEDGLAVLEGPAHLFEPEHLYPGGRGTIAGQVFMVVEVNLVGENREGAFVKVTAQRRDD